MERLTWREERLIRNLRWNVVAHSPFRQLIVLKWSKLLVETIRKQGPVPWFLRPM
jgi:hypothetical protein